MSTEPITVAGILKYLWAPLVGVLAFFTRKTIMDIDKRLDKLEKRQGKVLTEAQSRQLIIDLLAPILVSQKDIKSELHEVKKALDKLNDRI